MLGSNHLVVGIHVDALWLAAPRHVVAGGGLDVSRLPFYDGQRDVNGDVAFLASAVSSHPFEDLDVELLAGVHLHWTLPAALREGIHAADGATFPAAPNRWLVTRTAEGTPDEAWIVESDYLHPEANVARPELVAVPVVADPSAGRHQPFRYLGRTVPLDRWHAIDAGAEYLDRLTALGPGDVRFAAHYPSCRGVFGFHDPTPPARARYDVLGFYSDPSLDLLQSFRLRLAGELGHPPTADELADAIAGRLHLRIDNGDTNSSRVPDGLLLAGSVNVESDGAEPALPLFPDIVLAPSAAEAASTRVARGAANRTSLPSVDRVEEQLDLICLGSALDPQHVDVGFAFHELCHGASFGTVPGGTLWRLLPPAPAADIQSSVAGLSATAQPHTTIQPPAAIQAPGDLPPAVALALDQLNALQRRFDRTAAELTSISSQLYADWQKWMHSRTGTVALMADTAADPDRLTDFIERTDLTEHAARRRIVQRLDRDITKAVTGIERALEGTGMVLQAHAGQRYYLPAEPFVLFDGPAVAHTGRFGRPAPGTSARCPVVEVTDRHPAALRRLVDDLGHRQPVLATAAVDFHPVFFDWEVEFFPLVEQADGGPDATSYREDFLAHNYRFDPDDVDLRLVPERATGPAHVISGRSLLSRGARTQLLDALERFVWRRLIHDGNWSDRTPPPDNERSTYLAENIDRLLDHYEQLAAIDGRVDDPVVTALVAYQHTSRMDAMGHVLGGFNAALLMRRESPQLPVADPLGFVDQVAFTKAIASAVGDQRTHAASPEGRFHPLRAGDLSVLRLRIVDRFGRHISYDRDSAAAANVDVSVSRRLARRDDTPTRIHLPARVAQPGRIGAMWLSAGHDHLVEVSDHPATTPICGWFVADHLDRSLQVYDSDGVLAGSILTDPDPLIPGRAVWLPAPGGGLNNPDRLRNRHLRDAVRALRSLGPAALDARIGDIGERLDRIEPQAGADQPSLALLVDRPMALVRAQLDLELLGRPAVDQSWAALEQALEADDTSARPNRDFTGVGVGVRLGEIAQLDDGLLGYWIEGPDGIGNGPLHLTGAAAEPDVQTELTVGAWAELERRGEPLQLTLGGPVATVAMLVDPRAPVHISCGLLPSTTMLVPADHAGAALRKLVFGFLCAPLLSTEGSLHVPLPHEQGYRWVWRERVGHTWNRIPDDDLVAAGPIGIDRRQVLREGWLCLEPTDAGGAV